MSLLSFVHINEVWRQRLGSTHTRRWWFRWSGCTDFAWHCARSFRTRVPNDGSEGRFALGTISSPRWGLPIRRGDSPNYYPVLRGINKHVNFVTKSEQVKNYVISVTALRFARPSAMGRSALGSRLPWIQMPEFSCSRACCLHPPIFLFCRSRMAFVSFRNVSGLMVFLPFLKFIIALLATPDRRESSLLENCFASARI